MAKDNNHFHNENRSGKPTLVVVGSGIAGLSAAFLLKQKYDVTLIESHEKVGMGIFTVDYPVNGYTNRIDIPLRVFCDGYYPNLMALYRHIGVEVESGDHSGVFFDAQGNEILHYGNKEIAGFTFSYLKPSSFFSLRAWKFLLAFRRFNRLAEKMLAREAALQGMTFGQFLAEHQVGEDFSQHVLLPILAVTCTCDYQSILNYPADVILIYLTCGIWKFGIVNAKYGVDDIVPRLTQGIRLKTGASVQQVEKTADDNVRLTLADGSEMTFDQVVIASQAQQAAAMLQGMEQQKSWLATIPFEHSEMMVHTDNQFLPQADKCYSAVSYCLPESGEQRPQVSVDLSKAINRYQGQPMVFQTWNPTFTADQQQVLARVTFTRPVVTLESQQAMQQLRQSQQQADNTVWFCGSYLADKIPLLDAAVDSSVAIAQRLGVTVPWQK